MVLGAAYGLSMHQAGYGWLLSALCSILIFAGSFQFALIGLLSGGILPAVITAFSVNSRMLFYGLSLIDRFKALKKHRIYGIFTLTDETYSLLCGAKTPDDLRDEKVILYISALDHLYWISGSVLGGLLGQALPFDMTGVDFAMTALFTVIFVEQWLSAKTHIPAAAGLFFALVSLLVFGPERFLLPALIAIVLTLFLMRPMITAREENAA